METLKNIFLYDQESPLLFTRLYFWGFYAVVLAIYSVIYKKNALRNAYLFLVSLFFYYKTGGLFFFILLFSTTSNFFIGKAIYQTRYPLAKKLYVALSVLLNLGVLAFFKYDYFFTETINTVFSTNLEVVTHAAKWSNALLGTHFDLGKILPPVGISFFTFQTISYTVDVYLEKVKPVKSIADFGFYVSFFPQLVAGPIVRASQFIPQLYKKYSLSKYEFGLGLYLILKGLTKKMFVGDFIAVNLIDRVFADPITYTGFENLIALYGYSIQVYCDFSGYTDIAIGVALLLGFYLPKNFNSPYKAENCGEFWKRWHISLSSWLKDYLYIPMGGNRRGSLFTYLSLSSILIFVILLAGKLWLAPLFAAIILFIWMLTRIFPGLRLTISTNINIMMTMLLGGLWHGSSWMFVIWGGLNGIGVVVYKFWKRNSEIGRWIIFSVLNLTALLTFLLNKLNIAAEPCGTFMNNIISIWSESYSVIIWIALNVIWFISYFVWKIKWAAEKGNYQTYLNPAVSIFLLSVFSVAVTYITGLNNAYNPYLLIGFFIILGASGYYIFSFSILRKWGLIPLLASLSGVIITMASGSHSAPVILWLTVTFFWILSWLLHVIKSQTETPFLVHFWGIFLTFNFITFTRIWFRGESMKGTYDLLTQVSSSFNLNMAPQMISSYWKVLVIMIFALFVHWIPENTKVKYRDWFINTPIWLKMIICTVVVFIIYQSLSAELQPFIYFQF
jgi:alginate O-acetyltransferase complex protein AlgI